MKTVTKSMKHLGKVSHIQGDGEQEAARSHSADKPGSTSPLIPSEVLRCALFPEKAERHDFFS